MEIVFIMAYIAIILEAIFGENDFTSACLNMNRVDTTTSIFLLFLLRRIQQNSFLTILH